METSGQVWVLHYWGTAKGEVYCTTDLRTAATNWAEAYSFLFEAFQMNPQNDVISLPMNPKDPSLPKQSLQVQVNNPSLYTVFVSVCVERRACVSVSDIHL